VVPEGVEQDVLRGVLMLRRNLVYSDSFRASRYNDTAAYVRRVYPESADWRSEPVREEILLGRRYTTWAPPERAMFMRRVVEGETVFSIAASVYGDSRLWYWILDTNPRIMDPLDLPEGMMLRLAPAPVTVAAPRI